jgi:hypothetical protein
LLYVADSGNHCIRQIQLAAGIVSTFAGRNVAGYLDAQGTNALFSGPEGITVDARTNLIYISDSEDHRIRVLTPNGIVTTVAGTGIPAYGDAVFGSAASFNAPTGLAISPDGAFLFVSDFGNHRIRCVNISAGSGYAVTTFIGSGSAQFLEGVGTAAGLSGPLGLAFDLNMNLLVIESVRLLSVTPGSVVTTLQGAASGTCPITPRPSRLCLMGLPNGVAIGPNGEVFVSDGANQNIRRLSAAVNVTSDQIFDNYAANPIAANATFPVCDSMWHHVAITCT